ncbi:TAT-variant-translocated molybdopterin oxidoreductase [Flavisolibacter ginsenosidimutans]|uniref:4Fe-4S dicluster domain-containing protein n=1 Tax=Flavisolibacter ginsenosidimutans TaxID=661481 RepID=A0A5B8UL24_9BACT|nr:TAT-variant-translocated molybdopterin oxidoreductase [Flavisolibacter ginsenosidimutans]QEC57367.1 4Fe-4S dicluster domain-containing protein [Flavisolibacter ginsenosidimutans]
MSDKRYWQSFAELNHKEEVQKKSKDEFAEELPFGELEEGILDAKTPRRDFLKYLGFSTAAATIAASCEVPVRKAMPYVNRPENLTPGVAKYFASTYVQDGDVVPVVVKVREGRPIKIEGNTLYPFTQGGTSSRVQASVLDLYDMYRTPHPKRKSGNSFQEIPTFEQVDQQIAAAVAGLGGLPVVLLTSTIVSPSTKQIIAEFLAKNPGSRHVQYDAISYSGLIAANGGKIPAHNFDRADVVVSLGADFLGTWLSPVEFARAWSVKRKINEKAVAMSKHYQFESYLSMTGANADERFTHRPSETGAVALALLAAMGGGSAPSLPTPLAQAVTKVANDLKAHNGRALVVSGSNDPNVQTVVREINRLAGAFGTTIDTATTLNFRQGDDAAFATLVDDMNAGRVGALLIYGPNPAYDYFDADKFKAGLAKTKLSVSFNEKLDETSELCQYLIPANHYLESWGDAEPRSGYISFIQPTIFPLFKTRPFQTSLLKWSGNNTDYETYFRTYWTGKLGGQAGFDKVLQDGVLGNAKPSFATTTAAAVVDTVRTAVTTPVTTTATRADTAQTGNVGAAVTALSSARKSGKDEVVLYQKVSLLSGKQSGNPWLMEVPDPITKATWDNYAMISTKKAEELGIDYKSMEYEYYQDKPVVEFTANGKKITLPVLVIPGMDANTIAIAVGYGRSKNFNPAMFEEKGIGQNVYPFARWNAATRTIDYTNDVTTSAKPVDTYKIARSQVHNSYEGRTEVVKETTLATFKAKPEAFRKFREELKEDFAARTGNYRAEGTLYDDPALRTHEIKWGMSIDLNSCIGCGACVVACHLENNVPVVGKNEVLRAHEMHWLRIDRYFVTDEKNPDNLKTVVFQPMLCQHCENAPCENVCPVAATMHNSEGINQMAYNRCIGTRYCANNCPYKVRRFNWGDYTGASTHGVLGPSSGVGELNQVVHQMNDELTRMVLNPDVVTRSRGVMEKCSFCVQRTQLGKLQAKMENRPLGGDDVTSACAQACPTNAIVFGNAYDKNSSVAKMRADNQQRLFYVIEQIHTLPNVNYLAKIRNTDELIVSEENANEHAAQQHSEPATPQQEPATEGHK